jgi:hypothetical protein
MSVGFESGSLKPYLLTSFKERAIDAMHGCQKAKSYPCLKGKQTHLKNTVRSLLKSFGIRLGAISAKKFSTAVMKRIDGYQEIVTLSIKCLLDAVDKLVEEYRKDR